MAASSAVEHLLIRPAGADDAPALVEQFLGLNCYEEPLSGNRRTDTAGAALSLEAALARVKRCGGHALVASWDGAPAGHLFLTFEHDAPYVREALRPFAQITELFVREEFRRRGIAPALIAEAERLAQARGVERLMIGVLAGNALAEPLYRRLGFVPAVIEMAKHI